MPSVLIAGGGLAGLTCAWRLARAGHDVEVLEVEARPGGRVRAPERGVRWLPQGAEAVPASSRNLLAVARALGVAHRETRAGARPLAVLREGRLRRVERGALARLLRSDLMGAAEKFGLARLAVGLWRHRAELDPLRPEHAVRLELGGIASGLYAAAGPSALQYGVGPLLRARLGCELEDVSPLFALLGLRFLAEDGNRVVLDAGLPGLAEALAAKLRIRSGCEVTAVETEPDGARLRFRSAGRERSAIADAVVVALPGHRVVACCPKLTPAERGFFESVEYARGLVVDFAAGPPGGLFPFESVAFPEPEGLELAGIDLPETGGLVATLRDPAAERLWDAPDAVVVERVVADLAHTPIGPLPTAVVSVHRWPGLRPRFGLGTPRRLESLWRRSDRSPRLAFAGDYLVGPTAEAAVTSGMRAAAEIARGLG